MLKFVKDFLAPILCLLAMLGGMAYSSGLRDEKISTVTSEVSGLKQELQRLRESVDQLNKAIMAATASGKDAGDRAAFDIASHSK